MVTGFDRSKSLQELEDADWGEPKHPSALIVTCHRLHRKPLAEFTATDLRIMIGQGIGLPHLVPLAVEILETNPLAEGNCYPGDLLAAVIRIDETFWGSRLDWFRRMCGVIVRVKNGPSPLESVLLPSLEEIFARGSPAFREILGEPSRGA